ncbi:hypothetical protein [Marispirochaeta aestuarii]|uniref:hypothetical protein n=1 Tax=Marispirochaeta aestuarii TaxID=1963862 RepID=UPI0029C8BE47|nr:hypothetical protein [Marispirochaeta aestuarii]
MKVRSPLLAVIIVAVFVSGIGLSMAFNLWRTEASKEPARYESGEFAGEYNPADIRGSYTFGDIEDTFGVPAQVLGKAFALGPDKAPAAYQVKELEESYGELPDGGEIGTDSVRLFTALYLGLPYTAEETTRLPAPALDLLKEKLAPADIDSLRGITAEPQDLVPAAPEEAVPENTVESAAAGEVKGNTTFGELLEWGLTREQIEGVLGIPMGPRTVTVRDYVKEQGLEFSVYRTALQELLNTQ